MSQQGFSTRHRRRRNKSKQTKWCGDRRALCIHEGVSLSTGEVPIVTAQTIDCIAGLDALAEGSVPVVVTSPPYNIGIKYSKHIDRRADYLDWMFSVFTAVYRALAPDGHLFLQVGGIATSPNIPSQVLERAEKAGFILQNEIIWVKNISIDNESYGHFKPLNSARFLNHTHEFIYHLTKTGDVPVNRLAVGVPFKDKANVGRFSHPQDLRCRGNTWFIPYETIRRRRKLNDHPAIFPVELPTMCIQLSGVPRGSLIVDPFVGSGSTLVACKRLGMRGLGFDIDAGYVENANQRLTMSTPHGDEKDPPVVALANATQSAARRLSRNARRGQGRLTREGSAEEGNPTDCTTSNSMRIVNTTATTPPAVRTIDSGSIPILSPLRLLDDQGPAPDELRDAYPLHESTDSRDTVSATSQSQAQPPFTSAWQSGEPCPDQRAANALPKPVAVRNTRRTYLRYPGGKSKALSKMVPFFPNMFTQYREPMVGGGSAFLYIRQHFPHVRCWINDLDYGVYCFWKMAQERNAELVDELLRIKKSTEGDLGKQFFNDIPAMMAGADKFWTAVGFYYRNKCSFSGLTWQGTFCANPWVKNFSESCIRSLRELETTLAGVVITNVDYTNLLQDSGDDIFTYLDPPYDLGKIYLYGNGGASHRQFDHLKFFEDVSACKHKVFITYNENDALKQRYSGLFVDVVPLRYTMRPTVKNGNTGKMSSKMGPELFIRNYEPTMATDDKARLLSQGIPNRAQFTSKRLSRQRGIQRIAPTARRRTGTIASDQQSIRRDNRRLIGQCRGHSVSQTLRNRQRLPQRINKQK